MHSSRKITYRVKTCFHLANILLLLLVLLIVAVVSSRLVGDITDQASKNSVRFHAVEAMGKLNIYLNRELSLVQRVAKSRALIDWFDDEDNQEKRVAAAMEMLAYVDMFSNTNLYFGINASLHEFSILPGTKLTNFVPFDTLSPTAESDLWYFDCIASPKDYLLNIDTDKVSRTKRLWINHKVTQAGKLLGVLCSGLDFDQVFKRLFGDYKPQDIRSLVVNAQGVVQMDSAPAASAVQYTIQEINADPAVASALDAYLANISGYFDLDAGPIIVKLTQNKDTFDYMSAAPIAFTDWTVITFFNSDSLFGTSWKLLPLLLAMSAALVIYAIAANLLGSKLIFTPFNRITRSIAEVGVGKDQRVYGLDRNDEFGALAETIQNLHDRLSSYNEEMAAQSRLQRAVNAAASLLLASDKENFEPNLRKSMGLMAHCVDIDRVRIWKNHTQDGKLYCSQVHEWSEKVEPQQGKAITVNIPYAENIPGWEETLSSGQCINGLVHTFSQAEQAQLMPQGIISILVVPVFFHEYFWGFVVFDDCHREREFSGYEENLLHSGGLLAAHALLRHELLLDIQHAAAKYEAVISNYSGIIWSVDKNRVITTFNGLYLKKIGVTPSFLEGKPLQMAQAKNRHLDIIEKVEQTFVSAVPQDWISEIDGIPFDAHIVPLYDGNGEVTGVVGNLHDISESIKLQKALEAAVEEAKAASNAKSEFLSHMSHEMRTPMNAIIGMTAIGKTASDAERKDYALGKIEAASTHLLGVINDILDISKIEAGKFELSPAEFNFEKMLQKVVTVNNFRMEQKQQAFAVRIDRRVPRVLIGDDQRLTQVITNLLSNAVKFTPEQGSIHLNALLLEEEHGMCTVQIAVTDTGIGVSAEQISRLFTSFEQADSGISRKFGGTGLGLAISKRIVEMMGGSIRVESELGKGTTFIFTIKAARGADTHGALLKPGVNWQNIRILAVDDMPEMREYFTHLAESIGFSCDLAANAAEALEMTKQSGPYDIYFVDWKMPDMDGIELSSRIKARGADKGVIILMSSSEWASIADEAREAGVDGFLPKPIFPSAVADCLNECFGLKNALNIGEERDEQDHFEGYRILLADDVEINREIVLTLLEPTGLELDCAENGLETVRLFSENPGRYHMIFMDIQMPEMDGMEATRRIRALDTPNAKTVPIVAMTANVFREDIDKCLTAGMNDHVGKPLDFDDVLNKLRKYLPKKQS